MNDIQAGIERREPISHFIKWNIGMVVEVASQANSFDLLIDCMIWNNQDWTKDMANSMQCIAAEEESFHARGSLDSHHQCKWFFPQDQFFNLAFNRAGSHFRFDLNLPICPLFERRCQIIQIIF